jgi:membrane protease subunit (stomatin/prohibitin family)
MALWNAIHSQLIDIVEWLDPTQDTMLYRFYRPNNEIKNGAKLVVREGQAAAFVNEGQLADVFLPGTFTLATANLPILSDLRGWKYGFESPFKAEVYFVSTRLFTDRKWGTQNPIMLRDPEFGPVRLRAFGTFAVRVKYPPVFLRELAGTTGRFSIDDIDSQLRDMVTSRFADALGSSKIAVLDLAGNYAALGDRIIGAIQPDFAALGLELAKLVIENISLPAEVEAALDKRTSMGVIGNLNAYTQYETANAIKDAAQNPGGFAGAGAGLAAGMVMGQQMLQPGRLAPEPADHVASAAPTAAPAAAAAAAPGAAPPGMMPPPVPAGASPFFVAYDGKQSGPFTPADLQAAATSGKLTRSTLVWQQGMPAWTAAGQVSALASLFENVPPPLPPGL